MGDVDAVEACFRRAGEAHAAGRYDESLVELAKAADIQPDSPELHFNIGNVQRDSGALDAATASFITAIGAAGRQGRAYPEALLNLGDVLTRAGRLDKAEEAFQMVLAADPRRVEAYIGLGFTRFRSGDYEGALDLYRTAERLAPDHAPLLNHIALTLERLAEPAQALQAYDRAIASDPDHAEARVHRAQLLLLLGRTAEGFAEYEWRRRTQKMRAGWYKDGRPEWRGEDPRGLTILVHGEQGFGDVIQFARYLTELVGRGAHVVAAVEPALVRLIATVPGVGEAVAKDGLPLPDHDLHVPLLSLPYLLHSPLPGGEADRQSRVGERIAPSETLIPSPSHSLRNGPLPLPPGERFIPAAIPYLSAPAEDIERWRKRLAHLPGLRVGLVWTGRPEFEFSAERGLRLEQLASLGTIPGISFVSLQQGAAAEQPGLDLFRPGAFTDFADTAGLLETLDLLVATDTSVPHLAGALGKPVWLLLQRVADWRWGLTGDSVDWYPTLRLFRQERRGEWADAIAMVARNLQDLANTKEHH